MRLYWLPHSVDSSLFHPQAEKKIDALLTGAMGNAYPERKRIYQELKECDFFTRIERPSDDQLRGNRYPEYEDYAQLLSWARVAFATGSIYSYPVAKYFEIPACGTILMGEWFDELGDLGFEPYVNMVPLKSNLEEYVRVWLTEGELQEKIVIRGLELIQKRHLVEIRARQLMDYIRVLIGKFPRKILWLSIDRSNRLMQHFDSLRKQVATLTDVSSVLKSTDPWSAGEYSRMTMIEGLEPKQTVIPNGVGFNDFDFVMCDALFAYSMREWERIRVPKGVVIEDMHGPVVKNQIKLILHHGATVLFHRYKHIEEFHRELQ